MNNKCGLKVLLCSLLLIFAKGALAEETGQFWTSALVLPHVSEHVRLWLETQGRFSDDVSRFSQGFVRSGLGYDFNKQNSIWLGYDWFETSRPYTAQTVHENRVWQQYLWVRQEPSNRLISRTRLEQRFVSGLDVGWRLRELIHVDVPLFSSKHYIIATNNEFFYNLNTMTNNQAQGFEQNRWFLGVGVRPKPNVLIQFGYLNQFVKRKLQSDFTGHGMYLFFVWS